MVEIPWGLSPGYAGAELTTAQGSEVEGLAPAVNHVVMKTQHAPSPEPSG